MKHELRVSENRKYILMTVTGTITRDSAMAINVEAHALGEKEGISSYLVDLRNCRNTDSVVSNYKFAYDDMKHSEGIDRAAHVAFLVAPDDHTHDFIETVARNAGMDVTIFRDLEAAIRHVSCEEDLKPS